MAMSALVSPRGLMGKLSGRRRQLERHLLRALDMQARAVGAIPVGALVCLNSADWKKNWPFMTSPSSLESPPVKKGVRNEARETTGVRETTAATPVLEVVERTKTPRDVETCYCASLSIATPVLEVVERTKTPRDVETC
ncbi:hypothetical protein BaRGS_00013368 [Batillaria attramentaria]|uniref:Uncharacterized protein n=1 Tax=Batillaria attramentaria TaxID=370345 RepID=A0ABD0L8K4_9CAEN